MLRSWCVFLGVSSLSMGAVAGGCSSDDAPLPSNYDSGAGALVDPADSGASDANLASDVPTYDVFIPSDGGTSTFAYHPGWGGVTEVDVIGGFGTSDDWDTKNPYLKLNDDGTGTYTGSANLPAGVYPYLFHVVGDSASNDSKFDRYAIDPLNTSVAACPAAAPTGTRASPPNPCSQFTVGTALAAPVHVRGTFTVDGAPATGWLVSIERQEKGLHHFFVNRVTAGSDGSFDLIGSAGAYKIDVDLPMALSQNDLDRDPLALNTLRSAGSNIFPITTDDIALDTPDLAFHDYATFAPTGNGGSLPTMFTFEKGREAALDVYGGSGGQSSDDAGVIEVGDPWFISDPVTKGKYTFDGNFSKGDTDAAVPDQRYMWGTEEPYDASVPWKLQTLVFPITWH